MSHAPALAKPPATADLVAGKLTLRLCNGAGRGQLVRLAASRCSLGSAPHCTLRLRAQGIEPLHATIDRTCQPNLIRAVAGKTLLNGESIVESMLQPGDRLRLGPVEFEVLGEADVVRRAAPLSPPQAETPTISPVPPALDSPPADEPSAAQDPAALEPEVQESALSIDPQIDRQLDALQASLAELTEPAEPPRPAVEQDAAVAEPIIPVTPFAAQLSLATTFNESLWAALPLAPVVFDSEAAGVYEERFESAEVRSTPPSAVDPKQTTVLDSADGIKVDGPLDAASLVSLSAETPPHGNFVEADRVDGLQASLEILAGRIETIEIARKAAANVAAERIDECFHTLHEVRAAQTCWAEQQEVWERRHAESAAQLAARYERLGHRLEQLETRLNETEQQAGEASRETKNRAADAAEQVDQRLAELRAEREAFQRERRHSLVDRIHAPTPVDDEIPYDERPECGPFDEQPPSGIAQSSATPTAEPSPPAPSAPVSEADERAERARLAAEAAARLMALSTPKRRSAPSDQEEIDVSKAPGHSLTERTGAGAMTDRAPTSSNGFAAVAELTADSFGTQDLPEEPQGRPPVSLRESLGIERRSEPPPPLEETEPACRPAPSAYEPPQLDAKLMPSLKPGFAAPRETAEDAPSPEEPHGRRDGSQTSGDDESIEDYMARLMQRVRGMAPGTSETTPRSQSERRQESRAPVDPPREEPRRAGRTEDRQRREAPPSAEPEVTKISSLDELQPRAVAPEHSTNIAQMRDLANSSARVAIDVHARKRLSARITGKAIVAAVGFLATGALLCQASWTRPAVLAGGAISGIVTALWTLQYLVLSGHRKFRPAAQHITQDNAL